MATPQLENWLYHDALHGLAEGTPQPLSAQIAVAEEATQGNLRLLAVRPAPALGETTRIMFADPGLGESESRAIFCRSDRAAGEGRYVGLRHQRHPCRCASD